MPCALGWLMLISRSHASAWDLWERCDGSAKHLLARSLLETHLRTMPHPDKQAWSSRCEAAPPKV